MPTKKQLEEQNKELFAINSSLKNQVPEIILKLIKESDVYSQFIKDTEAKHINFSRAVSDAETDLDKKSNEINQRLNEAIQLAKGHIADLQQKIDEAINAITGEETASIEKIKLELVNSNAALNEVTESNITKIKELTEDFKELAGTAYYNKSSDKIADEYRRNAKNHKEDETKFQYIGGGSIIGAIAILLGWLGLVICGLVSTETEYHWLPVATITSLFIFLSRWSARIAYRHGLDARRLNQFALELTAMPAFFRPRIIESR